MREFEIWDSEKQLHQKSIAKLMLRVVCSLSLNLKVPQVKPMSAKMRMNLTSAAAELNRLSTQREILRLQRQVQREVNDVVVSAPATAAHTTSGFP